MNNNSITDYTEETQKYWREESGDTAILPSVTNFKIEQDQNNKAILHLSWDSINIDNFSHYQIRCSNKWKIDKTDKHTKVIDNIKTTSIDFYLTDYLKGVADITFWIAGYDLLKNRSKTLTAAKGIYYLAPSSISDLKVTQDNEIRDKINISWKYEENANLDRFLISFTEENCKTNKFYVDSSLREYSFYVDHNGLLEVTITPQNKDGAIAQNPIKNLYMVNLNPEPVKDLNVSKDEYGLVHIKFEDPLENHISDNDFEFEILVTKEDVPVHNLKVTEDNTDVQNLKDGFLNDKNTLLDSTVLLEEKSNYQGVVIYHEVQKTLEKTLTLPEEGSYIIDVIVHKHGWYVNKDGVRKDYLYKSKKISCLFDYIIE